MNYAVCLESAWASSFFHRVRNYFERPKYLEKVRVGNRGCEAERIAEYWLEYEFPNVQTTSTIY